MLDKERSKTVTVINEMSPVEMFYYIYRRLWVVAVLTVVGGLVGLVFQIIKPPVYEARAEIAAIIDFKQTGLIEELEQDQLINVVVSLFQAPEIMSELNSRANQEGLYEGQLVHGDNIYTERKRSSLYLIARNQSAETAAAIANLWADISISLLTEAHTHAVLAQSLREYLQALETCPELTGIDLEQTSLCDGASLEEVNQQVQKVSAVISEETLLSKSIPAALSFDLVSDAEPAAEPVARERGLLITAGAVIGFFIGVLLSVWSAQKHRMLAN